MYCRWLNDGEGKRTTCWQKGKSIRKSECTPCLLMRIIENLTISQARLKAQWGK